MSFTLQTDAGTVPDANAYVSMAFVRAYHADRGVDLDTYDDSVVEGAIVVATDYIDTTRRYRGARLADDQTTEFPRTCLYYRRGGAAEGLFRELKNATAEYTLEALRNGGRLTITPTSNAAGVVVAESKRLGPIEKATTYAQGVQVSTKRSYPADALLAEFRLGAGGGVIR